MNKRFLFLAGIGFFLAGCSLAPTYIQPQTPIPAQWPQGSAYKDTRAIPGEPTAPELSRQEFFVDEHLQKIIETALDNNRDLRLAALNVERARALYGVQRAELFPAVNAPCTAFNGLSCSPRSMRLVREANSAFPPTLSAPGIQGRENNTA